MSKLSFRRLATLLIASATLAAPGALVGLIAGDQVLIWLAVAGMVGGLAGKICCAMPANVRYKDDKISPQWAISPSLKSSQAALAAQTSHTIAMPRFSPCQRGVRVGCTNFRFKNIATVSAMTVTSTTI